MFYGRYIIQYAAVFVVFLFWFINNFPITYFKIRNVNLKSRPSSDPITSADMGGSDGVVNNTAVNTGVYVERAKLSNRALYDGLIMLALGVVLNNIGNGNKTAGDIFALITMFALIINAILHWVGIAFGGHLLWIVAHISTFCLFLTPWCTNFTFNAFSSPEYIAAISN